MCSSDLLLGIAGALAVAYALAVPVEPDLGEELMLALDPQGHAVVTRSPGGAPVEVELYERRDDGVTHRTVGTLVRRLDVGELGQGIAAIQVAGLADGRLFLSNPLAAPGPGHMAWVSYPYPPRSIPDPTSDRDLVLRARSVLRATLLELRPGREAETDPSFRYRRGITVLPGGTIAVPPGRYDVRFVSGWDGRGTEPTDHTLDLVAGQRVTLTGPSVIRTPPGRSLTVQVLAGSEVRRGAIVAAESDGASFVLVSDVPHLVPEIGRAHV